MKKSLFRIIAVIILSVIFVLPSSGSILADSPSDISSDTSIVGNLGPVTIPVIYDGKRYEAKEFNKISNTLPIKVCYLDSNNNLIYLFSTMDGFCKYFSVKIEFPSTTNDTPNAVQEVELNGDSILTFESGYGYNWVNADQGGNCLAIQEGYFDSYLDSPWDNVISSSYYYDGDTYSWMLLYSNSGWSGRVVGVPVGGYVDDWSTAVPSFDNLASSVAWGNTSP